MIQYYIISFLYKIGGFTHFFFCMSNTTYAKCYEAHFFEVVKKYKVVLVVPILLFGLHLTK